MEVTDQEVAANPKKAQLLAVEGPLLAQIRQYMHDMPHCKAYSSPFAPAAHLDNSCRSLVRPLIKDGEEILSKLLKLKIVTQAATDMEGQLDLFLRYINGLGKWYDMGTEALHGKRRQDDLERDLDVLLYTKLSSSSSSALSSAPSSSSTMSPVTSPINSPPMSPRHHKHSSTSASPSPSPSSSSASSPRPTPRSATNATPNVKSWVPADACEGKDLERVRAAVEDIRHSTRAASLSPDARRARAIRASMTEKKRTVAPSTAWTGYATMRPSLGARSASGERSAPTSALTVGIALGRKPPTPLKPLPAVPISPTSSPRDDKREDNVGGEAEAENAIAAEVEPPLVSSSESGTPKVVVDTSRSSHARDKAAAERAMKRMNVRELDVRSVAEGEVKGASLAAFLIRSPPSARLSGLQLGSSRSTRCLRNQFLGSAHSSHGMNKVASAEEPLPKASSSGMSLRVHSPMWQRRRSVTINHLPSGQLDDTDAEAAADDLDVGAKSRSKEEGEEPRPAFANRVGAIVIGSKKEHCAKGAAAIDSGSGGEEKQGVFARLTIISQTIERVAHLVVAMQDQLDLYEDMLLGLIPASLPSSSSTATPTTSTSSPPWRAQVRSLTQQDKAAFLRRIRSANAILYSAASTVLGSSTENDDSNNYGGQDGWRRSGAWISASGGGDGRVEEEQELFGRRQAALGLVASMRTRLATFKQRLEDGLVDDTELTTEANRIGFVVEYLAHSLHQS